LVGGLFLGTEKLPKPEEPPRPGKPLKTAKIAFAVALRGHQDHHLGGLAINQLLPCDSKFFYLAMVWSVYVVIFFFSV